MKFLKENLRFVLILAAIVALVIYKQAEMKEKNDAKAAKQGNVLVVPAIEIK